MMEREDNLHLPLKVFYFGTFKMEDFGFIWIFGGVFSVVRLFS